MKRLLIALLAVLMLFSACGNAGAGEEKEQGQTEAGANDLGATIGGTPQNVTTLCSAADLEGIDVTYVPVGDIRESLSNDQFLARLQKAMKSIVFLSDQYLLSGAEGCYISTAQVTAFVIGDRACASAFRCYLFTDQMVPAGEILFYSANGTLGFNSPSFYRGNYTSYALQEMSAAPSAGYIFLTNGYDEMLLDADNQCYAQYGGTFRVEGDYYHALDWEAMAVSYEDITNQDNLVWIPFA